MSNPYKGRKGFDRVLRATTHSISGLRAAYHGESAFRQELLLAAPLLPAAFWLGQGWVEVSLLAGSVFFVLIVELLNSAIEATVDRISFEFHEFSKLAKDYASAAVMLSLLLCGGIWLGALVQRFLS
jgi:diacylglycerol kinase (ATP)